MRLEPRRGSEGYAAVQQEPEHRLGFLDAEVSLTACALFVLIVCLIVPFTALSPFRYPHPSALDKMSPRVPTRRSTRRSVPWSTLSPIFHSSAEPFEPERRRRGGPRAAPPLTVGFDRQAGMTATIS
jgi:hypothetical protein